MTMEVLVHATGHQVRCMLWVQVATFMTFNEGIGFLCGFKFFALNIFWASKDTCLFIQYVLEQDCTQSLVIINKTWVVLLISTIV